MENINKLPQGGRKLLKGVSLKSIYATLAIACLSACGPKTENQISSGKNNTTTVQKGESDAQHTTEANSSEAWKQSVIDFDAKNPGKIYVSSSWKKQVNPEGLKAILGKRNYDEYYAIFTNIGIVKITKSNSKSGYSINGISNPDIHDADLFDFLATYNTEENGMDFLTAGNSFGEPDTEMRQPENTPENSPQSEKITEKPHQTPHDKMVLCNMQNMMGLRYGYTMKDGSFVAKMNWKTDWKKEKSYTGTPSDGEQHKNMMVNCISYLQHAYKLNENPVLGNAWKTICDRDNYPSDVVFHNNTLHDLWNTKHTDIIYGMMFDWVYSGRPLELGLIDTSGNIPDISAFLHAATEDLTEYEQYAKQPKQYSTEVLQISPHLSYMKFQRGDKEGISTVIEIIKKEFIPEPGMTCHLTRDNHHSITLVNENVKIVSYNAGAIGTAKDGKPLPQELWKFGKESLFSDLLGIKGSGASTLAVSKIHQGMGTKK